MYRKDMLTVFKHDHHSLVRDTGHNLELLERKRQAIKDKEPFSAHSRMFLNFNWEIIESNWIQ